MPVKDFRKAKSRLSPVLALDERQALARRLANSALDALLGTGAFAGVLIATDSDDVAQWAEAQGAEVIRDGAPRSLGDVIDAGLQALAARGASDAVVLMSDLPDVKQDDVEALLEALSVNLLVVSPDRHEQGTNALAIRPPDRLLPTCFGQHDSYRGHLNWAREAGIKAQVIKRPGLARDLDLPSDLD